MIPEELQSKAKALARETRERLGLGLEPVGNIYHFLSSENIFVIEIPIEDSFLPGCFYFDKEIGQPWIMINTANSLGKQRLAAAHEYCHFLRHRDLEFIVCENPGTQEKPTHEKFADFFASEFLLPSEAIKKEVSKNSSIGPTDVLTLCLKYGISYSACLKRLLDNGYISEVEHKILFEFTDFKKELPKLKNVKRAVDGDLFMPTFESISPEKLPQKYVELALKLYEEKLITRAKLAEYLDTDLTTLELILKKQ